MLTSILSGDGLVLLAGGLLFLGVVIVVVALGGLMSQAAPPEKSLQAAGESEAPQVAIEDNLLRRVSRFVTPASAEELGEIRIRLAQAGYRRPSAVRVFHVARAASGLGLALLGATILPICLPSVPTPLIFGLIVVGFLLGFVAPSIVLDRLVAARRQKAEEGFPDMLDMLLVCVEAGQGFEQAARRIARELEGHNDVLAEELSILNDELWAGKDRAAVFHDFAQRLNVGDITAFVSALRQADQFGVSIADAIRVYAADMRFKRVMRAEGKANVMPLKVALASMLFTLPPTMIIMIGPSLVQIARSFTHV